jgi:hypothetical protein
MPQSNRMNPAIYEHLLAVNAGFEQVRRALSATAQTEGFERGEIARFNALAEETRAAIASYLTSVIELAETEQAGRLFKRRIARQRADETL